jgi:S-DNA-T family DNA segregation ATPase FtsK/SpoIIIE
MIDYRRLRTDLLALGLLAANVFVGLSLVSFDPADPPSTLVFPLHERPTNVCGPVGAGLAYALIYRLGLAAWVLLGAAVLLDVRLFAREPVRDPVVRCTGWGLVVLGSSVLLQMVDPELGPRHVVGSGGWLGALGSLLLREHFSTVGTLIIAVTVLLSGLLLAADQTVARGAFEAVARPFRPLFRRVFARWLTFPGGLADHRRVSDIRPVAPAPRTALAKSAAALPAAPPTADFKVNPPAGLSPLPVGEETARSSASRAVPDQYELPDLDLLEDAEEFPFEQLAQRAQVAATTLEQTFVEFGLTVKVTEIDTGPVVTQFELELEKGLRVSKVINLQDDLAIALRVPAVRVVSPIPGKNTVGVEVPNDRRVMVRLKELIEACRPQTEKMKLPLLLGKDVCGHPLAVDLAKMPHLLIAGRTGTGKSVCLNALIASLLMTRSPHDVKMLMIDPKMVELSPYMRIPHLMHPVITDMKKAEAVLAWAVDKMEERYDLLARCGVRHLDSFNKLGQARVLERLGIDPDDEEAESVPDHMPYIVIIADEMADMIMTSGKEVEGHIIRLAQKSRAVGIHLVLATQKPTVDVITGLIKSNLPARISFQVSSRSDSRVVLDEQGADRLLGNGDMLYLAPGTSTLTRAQGTYVSDDEVNAIIDFFSGVEPQYCAEIEQATAAAEGAAASGAGGLEAIKDRDDLYAQACEVVIREGRGSCSLLQRALGIGYGRAARMIDYMAEDGIVGPYNGSKHRDVLYTLSQWEALREGAELDPVEL